jgi:hypothetical protein
MSLLRPSWGPHLWKACHFISLGYSLNPTLEEKNAVRQYVESLKYLIPCTFCKLHFQYNLKVCPLTDEILSSKLSLITWFIHLHNRVNARNHKKVMSYEDALLSLFVNIPNPVLNTHVAEHEETLGKYEYTRDNALEFYNTHKKNKTIDNIVNIQELENIRVAELHELEEMKRKKEIDKQLGEELLKKNDPEQYEIHMKQKEELAIMREKAKTDNIKKQLVNSFNDIEFEQQKTIDVNLLIDKFMKAIDEQTEDSRKHEISHGLETILECL